MSNHDADSSKRWWQLALGITGLVIFVRFLSLGLFPLMDTTEARYGEMARIMAETGDWITPMFDYGVPFWGKPPMFTWLSAAGIKLFGVNEFAVRIPHLLLAIITLLPLAYVVYSETKDRVVAALAVAITSTSAVFIVVGGAVMTDTALTLAITLAMVSFWKFSDTDQNDNKCDRWGIVFFLALGFGMLSKGPLTLVLVGISLFAWIAITNQWRLIVRLPWFSGIGAFLLVAAPWYIMAEIKTPGFLDYFIVGEHFKRFVVSGWEGDLYGSAHKEVRGTIWLFWFLAALPWSPLLIWQTIKGLKKSEISGKGSTSFRVFLWCWMLSPLLLFTLAGNILPSYVMPAIPAMAILIACNLDLTQAKDQKYVRFSGVFTPALLALTTVILAFGLTSKQAEKGLLAVWEKQPHSESSRIFYVGGRPFSGQFYSKGRAQKVDSMEEVVLPAYIVSESQHFAKININQQCEKVAQSKKRTLAYCS